MKHDDLYQLVDVSELENKELATALQVAEELEE